MGLNIYSVNESGVSMNFEGETVTISGSIDCLDPGTFMSPFLNDAHEYVLKEEMNSVSVDILNLNFLNSSGIKEFVNWIMKLEFLEEEKKYEIKFLCNHEYLWQEPSIRTLAFLNPDYVKMELK
jgi:hypothetical protein